MVICKYFLNGNCRFGTKCVNEHLDVKQLLKSDVESAVNGNQWPLSCFGPFKEKPSIPNFIEDQSFEEIRMLCYGSKKQNFFDTFNQQFTKEVVEAKNKMKMLLSLNKEVMDVVLNLYNSSEPPKGSNQPNPFGLSAATNTQQSTGLFGNNSGQSSMFPFGGGTNNTASGGGGIFGGSQQQQKSILGQSAFGSFAAQPQSQQQMQGSSLFGPAQPQQQQQQQPQQTQQPNAFGGNIFAQAAQQTPVGGTSIFGGSTQPFGAPNTSVFSQTPNSGNIFAQAAQQTQPQAAVGGNIFAQAAQQTQSQQPAFGAFSQQPQQQQQQQAPPAFGAQMTQQSPFGVAQPQSQQQQRAFFGQSQQQQQQMQTQQNTGNIFASQMQTQQQQQPQQQSTGIFASAAANSPFRAAAPQQQQQQAQQQSNIFAQAAAAGYPQQQQSMISDRTYSKMENLTPQEIEAFKAETFELGKIPFSPPPRELVN